MHATDLILHILHCERLAPKPFPLGTMQGVCLRTTVPLAAVNRIFQVAAARQAARSGR